MYTYIEPSQIFLHFGLIYSPFKPFLNSQKSCLSLLIKMSSFRHNIFGICLKRIQNAKIFENIHLRWFNIRIHIGKRKKKTPFFNCKFLIEENGCKCEPEVWRARLLAVFSELKMRFLIPRSSKSLVSMIFV